MRLPGLPAICLLLPACVIALPGNPILRVNTPDPGIVHHENVWYSVSTSGCDRGGALPVRSSTDLKEWHHLRHVIAEGEKPAWIGACDFWAPEIHQVQGKFVCYYAARGHDRRFRIGAAVAGHPAGPYTHLEHPIAEGRDCSIIDPSYFHDPFTGKSWLLFKEDRNDLRPKEQTPIVLEPLADDGLTTAASAAKAPHLLIVNDAEWEDDLVESPELVLRGAWYYLFYSGNGFGGDGYAVGVARSRRAEGPYEKFDGNPILRSDGRFSGPGHPFVLWAEGRWLMFYHARERADKSRARFLMLSELVWDAEGWPAVRGAEGE